MLQRVLILAAALALVGCDNGRALAPDAGGPSIAASVSGSDGVVFFSDRAEYLAATTGQYDEVRTVTFDTWDDGTPITSPSTDQGFQYLTLQGATFSDVVWTGYGVRSYWNLYLYTNIVTAEGIRVDLPPGTRAVGSQMTPFYDTPATYSITLPGGETFTHVRSANPHGFDFLGVTSDEPIEYVIFNSPSTGSGILLLENFTYSRNLNAGPTAVLSAPASIVEGSVANLDASGSTDPDGDQLEYAWDLDGNGDYDDASGATAQIIGADDGSRTVAVRVSDLRGGTSTASATIVVTNSDPTLVAPTVPAAPVALQSGAGTAVDVTAAFGDAGTLDTHGATLDCDGGTPGQTSATRAAGATHGTVTGSCTFLSPGVYVVTLTVTDDDGGSATQRAPGYVVIYDPSAGFVTGGGWIDSPSGSFAADPSLAGKATFGFVSKYHRGAATPSGNTQFEFSAAGLAFRSTTYEWLVVAGSRAQFKGEGTIDDAGRFRFLLTAIDGAADGGADRFRIRIWDAASDVVVYDNQPGQADDSDATTALGGGSIVIHKP